MWVRALVCCPCGRACGRLGCVSPRGDATSEDPAGEASGDVEAWVWHRRRREHGPLLKGRTGIAPSWKFNKREALGDMKQLPVEL